MSTRVAVLGGGITGAFTAYFLARLGAEPVIVEREPVVGRASAHNPGGLNPLHGPGIPGPMQQLARASLLLHVEHWDEISRLSGISFGAGLVARVFVAMDDAELESLARQASLYNSTPGFSARLISGEELLALEPRVSPEAAGAMWGEGNARVDARSYTNAVAGAAVKLGAKRVIAEARGLRSEGSYVQAVVLDSDSLDCDAVVIATGPWSEAPARWLGIELPVEPVKGELLLAEAAGEGLHSDITRGLTGAYDTGDGRLWLGGTEARVGFDTTPTTAGRTQILDGIRRLIPKLGPLRVLRHVAGLRPVTPDGLPIAGAAPGWENVCIAMGGGRKGMLLSAGVGLAVAELVTGAGAGEAIATCAPGRAGLAP